MQSDFFEQPSSEPTPALPPPDRPVAQQIFLYDNQVFEDPGPQYSTQDVLAFLAQTYPELGNGTWTARTLPDGTEEITFVKVTGEKGSHLGLTPRQLIDCLAELKPADWPARELLEPLLTPRPDELDPLQAARLLELAPQIEAALQHAEQMAQHSQRIVKQCLQLTPVPQPKIPLGF